MTTGIKPVRAIAPGILAACHATPTVRVPNAPAALPAVVDTISFEVEEATRLAFDIAPDGRSIVFDLFGQL
ncbi:MAG: hypothetical protein ACREOG_16840 [Gemmatimonadaceae bacterium]